MYCSNCGQKLPENAKFCSGCGSAVKAGQSAPSGSYHYSYTNNQQPVRPSAPQTYEPSPAVNPVEAMKLFFTQYATFNGRSRRSEYWWVALINAVISSILVYALPDISGLWTLATLIPTLALCVRRLHDIGKSGWWYLIMFIPVVGQILMIVWFCTDSKEANEWGPNPKY